MQTYLKPNAIILLNLLILNQDKNVTDRRMAREIGTTSFAVYDLMIDLHVLGLVRKHEGYWQITESGKLARVLGTY